MKETATRTINTYVYRVFDRSLIDLTAFENNFS